MDWQKYYGRPCIEHDDQFEILQKFSNLTRLHWRTNRGAFPIEAFTRALEDFTWPHLEDLGVTGMMGKDKRIRGVIDKLPPLRRAQFNVKMFGSTCWSSFLSKHRDSLRVLDIWGCYAFEDRWALKVFWQFAQLEEFRTSFITIADIQKHTHAWNSVGLKKLDAFFISDTENPDENQMAFEMLSNFDKLESIDVSYNGRWESRLIPLEEAHDIRHPRTLRWRLDAGLGKLSNLKNLRRLVLDNRFRDLRVEDVEWMLEQWPLLSELTGLLSEDPLVRAQLACLLRARGVQNRDCSDI